MARTEPSPRFQPLANVLRKKRVEAGLSQAQVASAMGWQQSVVADVELARRRLNVYEFIDYVTLLGADPVEIIRGLVHQDVGARGN